ncbi:hypothetical protein GCM10009839_83380 [Catenulispora yoronensis]|uniref:Uncharacterized protein n=1 Tax=Catenulispora yoronensis TaxID=450799 RepID=A0ABN2VE46_9ACTN
MGSGPGSGSGSGFGAGSEAKGGGPLTPRLVVLAGRKGKPSLLPFVAVLLVLGLLGMVALLFLNTELNKGAFTIKQQKATATKLTQEAQQIQQSLAGLNGPGALASQASSLGMVPNGNPAFLAPNGSVLGSPSAAPTPTPSPTPTLTPPTPAGALPGAEVVPTTPAQVPPQPPVQAPVVAPTPTGAAR